MKNLKPIQLAALIVIILSWIGTIIIEVILIIDGKDIDFFILIAVIACTFFCFMVIDEA